MFCSGGISASEHLCIMLKLLRVSKVLCNTKNFTQTVINVRSNAACKKILVELKQQMQAAPSSEMFYEQIQTFKYYHFINKYHFDFHNRPPPQTTTKNTRPLPPRK